MMDTHDGARRGAECSDAPLGRGVLPAVLESRSAADEAEPRHVDAPGSATGESLSGAAKLIYFDSRAFTRDCVGRWFQAHLRDFGVRLVADLETMEREPQGPAGIRAVIVNVGRERASSAAVVGLIARIAELLPDVPVVVLSDHEDADSIREAFELGVRGYIPTSLASLVAVEAVRLVCAGGSFAPAAVLVSSLRAPGGADGMPLIEGFTPRQTQILSCLRRGMANKLIAYELNMCESTVKIHIRNIMKKLKATNRTQVVYLTNGFFDGTHRYHRA